MTSNSELTLRSVHQANIKRYCKILKTCLTDEERAFVESRLAEERSSLERLAREITPAK
jgi:hypothetical protein